MDQNKDKELDYFIERIRETIGKSKNCLEKKFENINIELKNLHDYCIKLIESKDKNNEILRDKLDSTEKNLKESEEARNKGENLLKKTEREKEDLKKKLDSCHENCKKMKDDFGGKIKDLNQKIEKLNQDLKNCRENSAQMRLSYEKIINDLKNQINHLNNPYNCEENLSVDEFIKNIREIIAKSKNCLENKMGNIEIELEKLQKYCQKVRGKDFENEIKNLKRENQTLIRIFNLIFNILHNLHQTKENFTRLRENKDEINSGNSCELTIERLDEMINLLHRLFSSF